MIVLRGYPSSIVMKGYAAGSGVATPTGTDPTRNNRDWRDLKRPWWWKKNINPKLAAPEASPQP